MRPNPIPLITVLLLLAFFVNAQESSRFSITLNSGTFTPARNIDTSQINDLNRKSLKQQGKTFAIIQFDKIPSVAERKQLQVSGIELLDYIPNNAYTVLISKQLDPVALTKASARSFVELMPRQKMQPSLASGIYPARIKKITGTLDVWISFPKVYAFDEVSKELRTRDIEIISTLYKDYRIIALRIPEGKLVELAGFPFVEYVQGAPGEDVLLNNKSMVNTRANILRSSLPGGRNLLGRGVVVGVGDDANPMRHIDFANRVINRTASSANVHGIHVMGTVGGAGIVNEKYTGYAPKSTILKQTFSNILAYAPIYVQDNGMVITNNSYGNIVDDCQSYGVYDLYSRVLDQQAFLLPSLQHVFAAGNNGAANCGYYPALFGNVLGGYQTAKNVITVGNARELEVINNNSSKGPVTDGRIKPEIVAQGTFTMSTWPINTYSYNTGTSMAAPAVSGGLALLYERYRQLHGDANPENGLMKALLCNGATDMGNPGPDYSYGFGWMNLLRSVTMLEQNNYINTSVNTGGENLHTINIPAGSSIARLKVMLYWNDSAGAILSKPSLVNDLDLSVTAPGATVHLPQLLDTIHTNVTNTATTGVDHFNNIEQVVINNPVAGSYTFSVKGTTIPSGTSHEYYIVYDTIPISTTLTYPVGGEKFEELDTLYVAWESYGNPTNSFNFEYSINSGSWTPVSTTAAAGTRMMRWQIPSSSAGQVRLKIIQNGTGIEDTSAAFTVIGTPIDSLVAGNQCEGYIQLGWRPVAGATDYEVMMLRGDEMVPVATTASSPYVFSGLSKDSVYWVSVRARINGNAGRRAIAVSRKPDTGTCTGNISNNDLKVDALLVPSSGRIFTSSALTSATIVQARIKNLDNAPVASFNVQYSVNNSPFVSEIGITPVASLSTYTHSFSVPYDFSALGLYTVRVVVQNLSAVDPVTKNDTMTLVIKHLPNAPIALTTTLKFFDDLESLTDSSFYNNNMGLEDTARYDFRSSNTLGRLRTFVNTGMAYSGNRAFTLDASEYTAAGIADSLKATFNLTGYNTSSNDIRLDFMYKHHGQEANAANRVWIRGDDQKPWIQVYDLQANQDDPGVFKKSPSLEISNLLAANSQTFSSSFQVRWGQWGRFITADNESGAGYTIDDIQVYLVDNDIQMLSIDTPVIASCGLGTAVPVTITVRNSSNTVITNIPIKLQVNNGTIITETVPVLNGGATAPYTFTATADLSAIGVHTIKVWVDLTSDTYRDNDTSQVNLYNAPIVSSFPYLQNFESGDGGWYSDGKNKSWEYGTPASVKINKAASGTKAWKTSLTGFYNDGEESHLYSPCFDLTGMSHPTLSFSIALDIEDCGVTLCDAAYMEYSEDGKTWIRLGANGQGTNWYNKAYAGNNVWSIQNYTRWHVATIPLPLNIEKLRLRFVLKADPYVSREGIAIDDIHVYNNPNGIYTGPPNTSTVITQTIVSGNNWIDFTDGGKLVASINPNGQTLGNTDAQVYMHTGAIRNSSNQYYHNRNITIKPANSLLSDSATVRFYFLDTETEALIAATGCAGCAKPASAYELGVSKYSDFDDSKENGTLADNGAGYWTFIDAMNSTKVPFDKGYYAEFQVVDFSEFWLNNGGVQNNQPLPVTLLSFNAEKQGRDKVLTSWTTESEMNTARFEIEVAKGNEEFRQNRFVKIGEINSYGNSANEQTYQFVDEESLKTGTRYYRLKMVDIDGRSSYSSVRPVTFNDEIKWQVYPNPSTGIFNLVYQAKDGEAVSLKIYDLNGKLVQQASAAATGFVQKTTIDISNSEFASGLYLLEAVVSGNRQVFRMMKK
jgi:hypothetical protein